MFQMGVNFALFQFHFKYVFADCIALTKETNTSEQRKAIHMYFVNMNWKNGLHVIKMYRSPYAMLRLEDWTVGNNTTEALVCKL